jgi:hypothetical protein
VRDEEGKWQYLVTCDECSAVKRINEVETDHIVPCGSVKSFDEMASWTERNLCEADGLRVLCKGCHDRRRGE